jgi:hypothetical protein
LAFRLEMYRGDGRTISIVATYPTGHEQAGQPFVLLDKTVWFTAKRNVSDADSAAVLAKKTGGFGIEVDAGEPNRATVTIAPGDTSSLVKGVQLHCDVQAKPADGDPVTLAVGTLTVKDDITRAVV